MRIVYGVFGYGRGHATRALAMLPELERRHEVLLFAGGDAYALLAPRYRAHRVPSLRFVYGGHGRFSTAATLRDNASALADLMLCGPALKQVMRAIDGAGA